ncbi:FadR/GntR family transcriptional regulator [Celerinatantimonas sp. YJH-8]|uniref:FadR/GntR family transcriptional regulator n=1 Tax=Celerinatantimonas sp. YJH-8 TaxID=3228714 RepID=UPI0038CA6D09
MSSEPISKDPLTSCISESDSSNSALDQLRQMLREFNGDVHTPLPTERELAERFHVGRRAIRRALDVLEEEGRIWRKQGKGTFVGPGAPQHPLDLVALPKQSNLLEVMETRLLFEPNLARLAAIRASEEQIALMRRLSEKMKTIPAEDADQNELWDSAFHRAIAEASGNRLLTGLFDAIDAIRRDPIWRDMRDRARNRLKMNHYDNDHLAIVDAIARRSPKEAAQAMRQHLLDLQSNFMQLVTEEEDE